MLFPISGITKAKPASEANSTKSELSLQLVFGKFQPCRTKIVPLNDVFGISTMTEDSKSPALKTIVVSEMDGITVDSSITSCSSANSSSVDSEGPQAASNNNKQGRNRTNFMR